MSISAMKQEPVAWLEPEWGEQICPEIGYDVTMTTDHPKDLCWIPLYPKREWVGLTDEEKGWCAAPTYEETIERVEAKLKEKNA